MFRFYSQKTHLFDVSCSVWRSQHSKQQLFQWPRLKFILCLQYQHPRQRLSHRCVWWGCNQIQLWLQYRFREWISISWRSNAKWHQKWKRSWLSKDKKLKNLIGNRDDKIIQKKANMHGKDFAKIAMDYWKYCNYLIKKFRQKMRWIFWLCKLYFILILCILLNVLVSWKLVCLTLLDYHRQWQATVLILHKY